MEIHTVKDEKFLWTYRAVKRDGRNQERRACFERAYGTLEVVLPIPTDPTSGKELIEGIYRAVMAKWEAEDLPSKSLSEPQKQIAGWIFQANPNLFDLSILSFIVQLFSSFFTIIIKFFYEF